METSLSSPSAAAGSGNASSGNDDAAYTPEELKKKIMKIHSDSSLSQSEKARLVQNLMTGRWQKAMEAKGSPFNSPRSSPRNSPRRERGASPHRSNGTPRSSSPCGGLKRGDSFTTNSNSNRLASPMPCDATAAGGELQTSDALANKNQCCENSSSTLSYEDLTEEERMPTYHTIKQSGEMVFGCSHYRRGCKLRAKCCDRVFPCRFCHDEESDHVMDRYATEEMYCMHCETLQPMGQKCSSEKCRERSMARYYCDRCKFLDDDPEKDIYHCPYCNLCRIGKGLGIDYFHCMKCNACMSTSLQNHRCVERSLESDCPICHHYMFTSTTPVMFMACGHCMHVSCFEQYTLTNYICPICSKSLGDMSSYFSRLDAHLAAEQLPEEYRNMTSNIFCSDCEKRSCVKFHFVYHKCAHCGSYNTKVLGQNAPGAASPTPSATSSPTSHSMSPTSASRSGSGS